MSRSRIADRPLALLLTLALSDPALAQTDADAENRLGEAVEKFATKDYEASLRLLDDAEKIGTDALLLARVHRQRGFIFHAQTKNLLAVVSFMRALSFRPDIEVSAQEHAASLVELFGCAKRIRTRGIPEEEVPKAYSEELGAEAWKCPVGEGGAATLKERQLAREHFDKAKAFESKQDLEGAIAEVILALGFDRAPDYLSHVAELFEKNEDFANAVRYLEEYGELLGPLEKSRVASRIDDLRRRDQEKRTTGVIQVEVEVTGARVAIDGKDVGITPIDPVRLPVGKHKLELSLASYLPLEQFFEVEGAKSKTIRVELIPRPRTGFLLLAVAEVGAKIRVDGTDLGVGPLQKEMELRVGTHEVVVEKEPEFLPFTKSVDIADGKKESLIVTLAVVPEIEPPSAWGWVLMASAGLLAGGGGVFVFLAEQERGRIDEASLDPEGAIVEISQVEARDAEKRGDLDANVAIGLFAGAGAALIGGLLISLLTGGEPEPAQAAITPRGTGFEVRF